MSGIDVTEVEGYGEAVVEYEPEFVQEYYEENGKLPELGLEVVYLGSATDGQESRWEAMGRHVADFYETALIDAGIPLEYVSLDYECIGRGELTAWSETTSWAFR